MALTIGQFLNLRSKNPDTANDPYDPTRESLLELDLPEVSPTLAGPSQLPPPPQVALSSPAGLPPPPNVTLGSPSQLPPEPPPAFSLPVNLPPPPAVTLSSPANLPPPPGVSLSSPAHLPPEVAPPQSIPAVLPPEPAPPLSAPGALPPPPVTTRSTPSVLPPAPPFARPVQVVSGPPPAFASVPNASLPPPPDVNNIPAHPPAAVNPVATPSTKFKILGETYSPIIGAADPGSLATDPFLYERSVEQTLGLPPGKVLLHAAVQAAMFAQNVIGNVWNPALINPPPIVQGFLKPALDIPSDGNTESLQVQIGDLVDKAMAAAVQTPAADDPTSRLTAPTQKSGVQVQLGRIKVKSSLAASFDQTKNGILAIGGVLGTLGGNVDDPLKATAFDNGVIPMRLKGDNGVGFRTFKSGQGDTTTDADVYMPLSFTDLRPIGDVFRAIYFRPLDLKVNETFSPMWNKAQYYGRVDPVATYQSTGRGFNVSFRLVAFGPEDVRTIYQKLHWLSSMVYPEYDSNLVYRSGPVVRMRVGDLVNGFGNKSGRGLPGIIESLDLDYSEALWELKDDFRLPRDVSVSLSFTVIHDVPMGRGAEGRFGGLGVVDSNGIYSPSSTNSSNNDQRVATVTSDYFRHFGDGAQVNYDKLSDVDMKKP